jgi:hypothetical protein
MRGILFLLAAQRDRTDEDERERDDAGDTAPALGE